VKLTVLIATCNRREALGRALESLFCESNLPRRDWEVVVVLNGVVNDGSREVCEAFRSRYPEHFRHLAEPRQGKSNALNMGIGAARGEILALTDDDVICAPDYVASVISVFEQYPVDLAQGRVFLECEGGLPGWMAPRLREFMSDFDCGDALLLPFDHHMTGTNMIVRRAAARAVGGFAPELGAGARLGFAEDTEFSLRLRQGGYRTMYAPQIVVRHQLPRHRLTMSFFRESYFRVGRSQAYYLSCDIPVWKYGRYALKDSFLTELKALLRRCGGHRAESLELQCMARWQIGFAWQHCLFRCGVSRRLTRVTSWPEPADARGASIDSLSGAEPARQKTTDLVSHRSGASDPSGSAI